MNTFPQSEIPIENRFQPLARNASWNEKPTEEVDTEHSDVSRPINQERKSRRNLNQARKLQNPIRFAGESVERPTAFQSIVQSSPLFQLPSPQISQKSTGSSLLEETKDTQVIGRPYRAIYLLPGRLKGKPVQFLIDTVCTTNLLSKTVFNKLPTRVKEPLEESNSHGTQLRFYGIIWLPFRVGDVKAEEPFVVSMITEDAILGMPFLMAHQCCMDFKKQILQVDGKEQTCTDRHTLHEK